MTQLSDAIDDLKALLHEEGWSACLLEEVCNEHGINPQLLLRKFEEATGAKPENWQPPVSSLALALARARKEIEVGNSQTFLFNRDGSTEENLAPLSVLKSTKETYVCVSVIKDAFSRKCVITVVDLRDLQVKRAEFKTEDELRKSLANFLIERPEQ